MVKLLSFLARDSKLRCTQAFKKYIFIISPLPIKNGGDAFEIALRAAGRFVLMTLGHSR